MLAITTVLFHSIFVVLAGNERNITEINCHPPNLSNGLTIINLTGNVYLHESSVFYACTVGRLTPSNAKQICLNGKWIGILPKCDVAKCPISFLKNDKWEIVSSNASGHYQEEDTFVKLRCLSDSTVETVKCLYNGRWQTPTSNFCSIFNDVVCDEPYLLHGSFECLTAGCDRFQKGVEIAFQCNSGYKLIGNYKSKCKLSVDKHSEFAFWESLPECVPISDNEGNVDSNDDILTDDSGIEKFTILVVVSASLLGALLVIIACVLVCRFTLCRKGFRPLSPPTRDPVTGLAIREADMHSEEPNRHCYTIENVVEANDDRAALINPPSYEEAMRSAGPFHICGGRSNRLYSDAGEDDSISGSSSHAISSHGGGGYDSTVPRSHSRQGMPCGVVVMDGSGATLPPSEAVRASQQMRSNARQRDRRHQELDSVSRHSTQTSASHGAALSGSVETMAISDGTSVTLRTFESLGSNPSLGSTRPQTGSLGEPAASSSCNQSNNHCIYDGRQAPTVCTSCVTQRNAEIKEPDSVSVRS